MSEVSLSGSKCLHALVTLVNLVNLEHLVAAQRSSHLVIFEQVNMDVFVIQSLFGPRNKQPDTLSSCGCVRIT